MFRRVCTNFHQVFSLHMLQINGLGVSDTFHWNNTKSHHNGFPGCKSQPKITSIFIAQSLFFSCLFFNTALLEAEEIGKTG